MALRVRKRKIQKFYIPNDNGDGNFGEFYFELRTIPNSDRVKAASEAYTEVAKRPVTQKARKKMMEAEEVEVVQKMRADLLSIAEKKLAIVSFVLPGEDGVVLSSSKLPEEEIAKTLDDMEEDLEWYLEQCIDVMQGNYPDSDTWDRLNSLGITAEMMDIPAYSGDDADEDPTSCGEDA